MANTKISELVTADTLQGNTLFVIVDRSTGTPITKKVELSALDTHLDITVDKANGAYTHANSAYSSQNTTGIYANASFLKTNSAFDHANAGFLNSNSAFTHANAAFVVANTPSALSNSSAIYANGAFVQSNAAFNHANAGFVVANTPSHVANSASLYANGSFIKTNAAFDLANINYTSAVTRLNVSNSATSTLLFDQFPGNNPTIHISSGRTIAFDLTHISLNPLLIRDVANGTNVTTGLIHVSPTGTVSYNDEAQGKNSGVLYWKVPYNISSIDYAYQSASNLSISGIIRIDPTIASVLDRTNSAFTKANSAFNTANGALSYTAANTDIWATSAPVTVNDAIDRLANLVYSLYSNTQIP